MKTNLPESISTIEQAKQFLTDLHNNGEAFYPDDDPGDFVIIGSRGNKMFTESEAAKLYNLMDQVFEVARDEFDPYLHLLQLRGYVKEGVTAGTLSDIRGDAKDIVNRWHQATREEREEIQLEADLFCQKHNIKISLDEWILETGH